jgi:hypothetical protein
MSSTFCVNGANLKAIRDWELSRGPRLFTGMTTLVFFHSCLFLTVVALRDPCGTNHLPRFLWGNTVVCPSEFASCYWKCGLLTFLVSEPPHTLSYVGSHHCIDGSNEPRYGATFLSSSLLACSEKQPPDHLVMLGPISPEHSGWP